MEKYLISLAKHRFAQKLFIHGNLRYSRLLLALQSLSNMTSQFKF